MQTMTIPEVEGLMVDVERHISRKLRENQTKDRWIRTSLETRSIPLRPSWTPEYGWHARYEAGPRRAYVTIRVPLVLMFAWWRIVHAIRFTVKGQL